MAYVDITKLSDEELKKVYKKKKMVMLLKQH